MNPSFGTLFNYFNGRPFHILGGNLMQQIHTEPEEPKALKIFTVILKYLSVF